MTAANVSQLPEPKKPKKKASVEAREAEADDGFATIEQCGVTLRIPLGGKLPLKAYLAFRNGDDILGAELMLGEKQWAMLLDANPTVEDLGELGTKLDELAGN